MYVLNIEIVIMVLSCYNLMSFSFLNRCQPDPIKSVLLVMFGWLVGLLVGNAFFSETAGRTFLIFFLKLRDYKGRKVTGSDFLKKILDLEIFAKRSPNYPKIRHFDIFLKNGSNSFFGFWSEVSTKYDLQFVWNLFFRKICSLEIFVLEIVKKIAQIEVFGYFLEFASFAFLDFAHNDRWAKCLVVFLQFAGPVNVFLFSLAIFFPVTIFSVFHCLSR